MSLFMTSDLQLASFLRTLGHAPVRIEGDERRAFVFAGVPEDAIASYYRGDHLVAPQALFAAYRLLKRQLFQTAA